MRQDVRCSQLPIDRSQRERVLLHPFADAAGVRPPRSRAGSRAHAPWRSMMRAAGSAVGPALTITPHGSQDLRRSTLMASGWGAVVKLANSWSRHGLKRIAAALFASMLLVHPGAAVARGHGGHSSSSHASNTKT